VYTRTPTELRTRGAAEIPRANLAGVARFFDGMPAGTRVVGMPDPGVKALMPVEWFLGVRYEPLDSIAGFRPELVRDLRALTRFLRTTRIAYVVLPARSTDVIDAANPRDVLDARVRASLAALAADGVAREAYRDAHYVVWSLDASPIATVALAGGGEASLAYDASALCESGAAQVATVAWHGAVPNVAIEVRAPNANKSVLFAQGANRGRAKTGPWVKPDAAFILRAGREGRVLGVLRAQCD
jgi:hypothetical protein